MPVSGTAEARARWHPPLSDHKLSGRRQRRRCKLLLVPHPFPRGKSRIASRGGGRAARGMSDIRGRILSARAASATGIIPEVKRLRY